MRGCILSSSARTHGVELAGAIAELTHSTLLGEFRTFESNQAEIIVRQARCASVATWRGSSGCLCTLPT